MEVKREVVKPSVWNLLERKIAPLWVNDDREDVILKKIQQEEALERELAKATPLYQIGNMRDVCQMLIQQHQEPKLDYATHQTKSKSKIEQEEQQQDTGLKKLIFVEMEEYPGFDDVSPCPLPQKVETSSILRIVTAAIKITEKPGLMKEWREFFFSEESQDILHDLFWWFFLKKFQKPPPESLSFVYERELREKTSLLFGRVAQTYTLLLNRTFGLVNREKLLLHYPNAVSQAVYAAYCHAFPVSWRRYDTAFKQDVLETVNLWMTGTKPMIRHWQQWDYTILEPPNMRKDSIDKDANNQKQKVRDKTSVDSILTFPSTSGKQSPGAGNKQADKQADRQSVRGENSHTSLSSSHISKSAVNESSRKNLSVHGSVSPAGRTSSRQQHRTALHTLPRFKGKQLVESHSAEPGPDFVLTKFDLSGHSPLVEYCLREQNLARNVGVSKLLSRKEISSYPSPEGQTYRQLVTQSRKRVKKITRDVNQYWEESRKLQFKTSVENHARRLEYQQKSSKLLDNAAVVSKLAEMIVHDRLHGTAGAAAKISSTIDSLIALQEDAEDKPQQSHS